MIRAVVDCLWRAAFLLAVREDAVWKNLRSVCSPFLSVAAVWEIREKTVQQRLLGDVAARGSPVELQKLAVSLEGVKEAHGLESYASPVSLYSEVFPKLVMREIPR